MFRALLCVLIILICPLSANAGKRVALVIGNSAYERVGTLANPRNDAADIAAALVKHGFEVFQGVDLNKSGMDRKVRDFAAALQGAEIGLFFYAGHGLQVAGQNYLVPVDAEMNSAAALEFEAVRVDMIQRIMERQTTTNILFLDACRDNPLARNLARAMGTRSTEISRGLAAIEGGVGTLISFSTQPGNVALDGTGRNSPFAHALVKHVSASKEDLGGILIAVRNDVMKETQRKQVPWEHSALTGRFFFVGPAPVVPPPAEKPPASRTSEAAEAWDRVKDATSPAALEAYIARYPDSFFADLARTKLDDLEKARLSALAALEQAKSAQVLARNLQVELSRVGCDPGAVDGKWGNKAKDALNDFVRLSKSAVPKDDPSEEALKAVSTQQGRVCPLRCAQDQREVNGSCIQNERPQPKQQPKKQDAAPARAPKREVGAESKKGYCWVQGASRRIVPCSDSSSSGQLAY